MDIDVMAPSALGEPLIEAWRRLQATDPGLDSPFLSPDWAIAVERAQAGGRGAVRVAALSENGAAKGFLAARITGSTAMPAGAPMNDYQALVAEPGVEIDFRRLARAFGVDRLDFTHWLADQSGIAPFLRGRAVSHVIDLSAGYDAYAAARRQAGSGVLKDIDKRRRKMEREAGPARLTAHRRNPNDLTTLIGWKRAQYRAGGQTDIFATPWAGRLVEDVFAGEAADFGAMLFTLHLGDRLAAAQIHLVGGHTLHAWIIAHDPDLERYSPGLVLFGDILRWMEGSRWSLLDLGAGDYRFKQQLANARTGVAHGFIGRASPAALWRAAEYGLRSAAERLPLGAASALPGKAMRRMDILRALR